MLSDSFLLSDIGFDRQDAVAKIKRKFKFRFVSDATFVIAIAISKNDFENTYQKIATTHGDPIQELLHDKVRDRYEFSCKDFLELGSVPFSCVLHMDELTDWKVNIPLPKTLFMKYLDEKVLSDFKDWKEQYPKTQYKIEFLQMVEAF